MSKLKDISLNEIIHLIKMDEEEYKKNIEYQKFSNEFWSSFDNSKERIQNKLIEYWFDNFQRKLEEKNWLKEKWYRLSWILERIEMAKEEVEFEEYIQNYKKFFKNQFSCLKMNDKKLIINKFQDPFSLSLEFEKKWIDLDYFDNILEAFVLLSLEQSDITKEMNIRKNYRKFKDEFWFQFTSSKNVKELLEFWFHKFIKEIEKRNWLKWIKDFNILRKFFDKNKEEFEEFKLFEKCTELWILIEQFSKDKIKIIKNFWIDNILEIIKKRWLDDYKRWIHIVILEILTWRKINNEWCFYLCENCWYKWELSTLIEQRMRIKNSLICERCFPINWTKSSCWEREVFEFIFENFSWKMISWSRVIENDNLNNWKKEIDIHLVHKNIWFEYNWTYWHSSEEAKIKDQEKIEQAKKQWITIYTIKEEDWVHKNENEKKRIIEILKKEWIYSPRNKEEINFIKNQEKFKDLWYILSQLDNEYEIERLSEFFWKEEIDKLSFWEKEELKIFWYHEIIERMKRRNIKKDFILQNLWRNLRRYVLTNFNEYSFNLEDDKFIKHFWDEYFNLTMLHKERLIYFWFEDFINELKRIKSYSSLPNAYVKIWRKLCSDMRKLNKKKLQEEKK